MHKKLISDPDKTLDFYKTFYEENRIALLQYKSLRKYFGEMVDKVLGVDYYNMAMDVYECDRICCEDIIINKGDVNVTRRFCIYCDIIVDYIRTYYRFTFKS